MKITTRRLLVAGATTALALGGLSSATAAGSTHQVRAADMIASQTTTGGDGSAEFLRQGIHLQVADANADYAVGVFATNIDLADVHNVAYNWIGTDNTPSIKYDVDIDGDGNWDCQLIGEKAYGGTDVWLNKDTQDAPDSALPADTCADAAPTVGGGSGAPEHGNLDDWATSLQAVDNKTPVVVAAGYGASGLVQNGVLVSITLGSDVYEFTSDGAAPAASPVTGSATNNSGGASVRVKLASDSVPAGMKEGKKITWLIKVGSGSAAPAWVYTSVMGADEYTNWTYKVPKGKSTVEVYKNGSLYKTFKYTR